MSDKRSLQSELATTRDASRERTAPERVALVERAIDALRNSDVLSTALRAGDLAPPLTLPDVDGNLTDLARLWSHGPVIVTFYRGGWCPYCSLELRAWQRVLPDVAACGATLVAISPQSITHSLSTIASNSLAFRMLSDSSLAATRAFRIAFSMSGELVGLYQQLGIEIPERNDNGLWVLPLPATYVVERGGRIAYAYVEVDYRQRAEPADVLAIVRDLSA